MENVNSNNNAAKPVVSLFRQYANNGRYVRMATQVVFPDGRRVRFLERLSKREALRAASTIRECGAVDNLSIGFDIPKKAS